MVLASSVLPSVVPERAFQTYVACKTQENPAPDPDYHTIIKDTEHSQGKILIFPTKTVSKSSFCNIFSFLNRGRGKIRISSRNSYAS